MKNLICGNWKMHKSPQETLVFLKKLFIKLPESAYERIDVAVAPPFTSLFPASRLLQATPIKLCAQDVFYEDEGAFTGEVSPVMLKEIGCELCIVGHSERRKYFGETDKTVNLKVKALLRHGIRPIVCVGETLKEREAGKTFEVVKAQVLGALEGVEIKSPQDVIIAYEPVWAIGTGKVASPKQAQEVHEFIRGLLRDLWRDLAGEILILYGGSVKPENIKGLLSQPDINGALVGGASLKVDAFSGIILNALEVV